MSAQTPNGAAKPKVARERHPLNFTNGLRRVVKVSFAAFLLLTRVFGSHGGLVQNRLFLGNNVVLRGP